MGKPAVQSTAVIGAIIAAIAGFAPIAGFAFSETDQTALRNVLESGLLVISNLIVIVGAVMAFWGRIRATRQITGVFTASSALPLGPSPPGTTATALNLDELDRLNRGRGG